MNELLLRWTIRIALVMYGLLLARQVVGWQGGQRVCRWCWTVGLAALLAHFVAAFSRLGWTHAAVVAHTAAETERLLGWRFGAGVWGNYLFALLWGLETARQWAVRRADRCHRLWRMGLHGYLWLVAINGAIVFAAGPTRPVGAVVCLCLAILAGRRWARSRRRTPPPSGPLLSEATEGQNGGRGCYS